jgi:hypothetical protein
VSPASSPGSPGIGGYPVPSLTIGGVPKNKKETKNAQSRARAEKLRERVAEMQMKPREVLSKEELDIIQLDEKRRAKKNARSRERALQKKSDIDRILAIPEHERSREDQVALEIAVKAKLRKNEGDRRRRVKQKEVGVSRVGKV